ncbi:MAG: glycosyltransferase family 39 protein [Legionellales bacterium]|nr:glycosyltransferase family 39 protein [Legionellales bacterium]
MSTIAVQRLTLSPVLVIIWLSLAIRIFFLGNHDLITEEAYYWNYATHMDFGYLDHPPMVAALIKLSTTVFGLNEFAVRCPALICWGVAAYYMYHWAELIQAKSGQYAILLLSILPFFFLNSCIITPDMPLLAAWSAALYYLYRTLCLNEPRAWYGAGISIGLGLLAKYSIALLIMTTGLFLLINREQRMWLLRKEPYYAALLILIVFSPVIYWNATHHWMSFAFQSTRRLQGNFRFSLPYLFGILALFLTPVGIIGFVKLYKPAQPDRLSPQTKRFLQTFLLLPLLVFALFSCFRSIKLDWIGPCLLAILPWLAYVMQHQATILQQWLKTALVLILAYLLILVCLTYGRPLLVNQKAFPPVISISWQQLSHDLYQIAAANPAGTQPILLPLDTYRIESELIFYQAKQWHAHPDLQPFPVHHAANFGFNGLMFELWDTDDLHDKTVMLISTEKEKLQNDSIRAGTEPLSSIKMVWGENPHLHVHIAPYYYQFVRVI